MRKILLLNLQLLAFGLVNLTCSDRDPPPPDDGVVDGGSDSGNKDDGGEPPETGLTVQVEQGKIAGVIKGDAGVFMGIPYATPPVGENRWRRPTPAPAWEGIRDGTKPGAVCPQIDIGFEIFRSEENCLTLNIWAPINEPDKPLPVMVWIHGGAFVVGSASDPVHNGKKLSQMGNVVVVSINYRLDALGFLSLSSLAQEDDTQATPGNYGFLDQQMALRWINENISAFGGDKNNVTIMGNSAGAISVGLHLTTKGSKGLFHRAIIQSGPSSMSPLTTVSQLEENNKLFVERLGCSEAERIPACLREKTPEQLLTVFGETDKEPGGIFYQGENARGRWGPVIDFDVITASPHDVISSGDFERVPIMLGSTADEGTLFHSIIFGDTIVQTEAEFTHALSRTFGEHTGAIVERYPPENYPSPNDALAQITGDAMFTCPTRLDAAIFSSKEINTYLYVFNRKPTEMIFPSLGVYHSSEVMFVFGNRDPLGAIGKNGMALSEAMGHYWTSFARTGNPNSDSNQVHWPRYQITSDEHILLDVPVSTDAAYKTEICDFWSSIKP